MCMKLSGFVFSCRTRTSKKTVSLTLHFAWGFIGFAPNLNVKCVRIIHFETLLLLLIHSLKASVIAKAAVVSARRVLFLCFFLSKEMKLGVYSANCFLLVAGAGLAEIVGEDLVLI